MLPFYYKNFQRVKHVLLVIAAFIVAAALWETHNLVNQLGKSSTQQMQVWAEAMHRLAVANETEDVSMLFTIINKNSDIPVILADSMGNVTNTDFCVKNLQLPKDTAKIKPFIDKKIKEYKSEYAPITIVLGDGSKQYVYYGESYQIKGVRYFTFITLGIICAFLAVVITIIVYSKRAEQNLVWAGLTKETAHQLGTPISSLIAWVEVLKMRYPDSDLVPEMAKDVNRLQIIAERFSKIGSTPKLERTQILPIVDNAVNYLRKRVSKKVEISTSYFVSSNTCAMLSKPLFEWVVENLCKNAVDAIEGKEGDIKISVSKHDGLITILVKDSGKGIPKSKFNTVFKAGYSTKKRGWGLGLSLVKRIVEIYHKGHIYVKESGIGNGTTFCIKLKEA